MVDRISEGELEDIKRRNPCDEYASRFALLRRQAGKSIGPCPICSPDPLGSRDGTRFEATADGWTCAACCDGGDVIALAQRLNDCDFKTAVDILGGKREIDPAEAIRLERERAETRERRERVAGEFRERERRKLWGMWQAGVAIAGTPAEAYLKLRGITLELAGRGLRFLSDCPYYADGKAAEPMHKGPAMLAAIIGADGRFAGLHFTWIDGRTNGKLALRDPETGDRLPAKKVRGSKSGGHIELVSRLEPRRLVIGEGIETVASVAQVVATVVDLDAQGSASAFWTSVDLGNLGGKAVSTIAHPSAKGAGGKPVRVPGRDPDRAAPGLPIPDTVDELVLLGDGDSDRFTTQCALERAAARYARPGRTIKIAFAPDGQDFNDLARSPGGPQAIVSILAAAMPYVPQNNAPAASATDKPKPKRKRGGARPGAIAPLTEMEKRAETLTEAEIDDALIAEASELDTSDTDNAARLELFFGGDLTVMAQSGNYAGEWLAWSGRHWDLDGGQAAARLIAQKVGDLIKAEADLLTASKAEREAIDTGENAKVERAKITQNDDEAVRRRNELDRLVAAGSAARLAVAQRKKDRRRHAVASKNAGKVAAMLDCLAPRKRRSPDDFNRDPMLVATKSHTLKFTRHEYDDGRAEAEFDAVAEHDRGDLITALVPVNYDPKAICPKWLANLERFQPDAEQRRTIQQFAGLGLLGLPVQKVMFHYGTGGNFKSVFLEVVTRVLGESFAIGLPAESISGREERGAGQASPDLARVFGKRMLRVLELPDGQPLQAGTIKKLTGGEKWPVRTLFKGYFEFQPFAKTHMSGNSLPHFDGSDGGMRRRMLIVEWPVTIKEAEQRNFETVVSELVAEAPGILNWLIVGALDYLQNGLVVADGIAQLTRDQVEEMDPIGAFFRECVVADPDGPGVVAREMYRAYSAWSEANAKRPRSETKFGREFKKLCRRDDSKAVRRWVDVALEGVPASDQDAGAAAHRRDFERQERRKGTRDDALEPL